MLWTWFPCWNGSSACKSKMYRSNNVEMIFHSLMKYCSLAVNPCLPLRIGKEMVWSSSESKCFPYFSTSLKKQKSIEKKKKANQISFSFCFLFCFYYWIVPASVYFCFGVLIYRNRKGDGKTYQKTFVEQPLAFIQDRNAVEPPFTKCMDKWHLVIRVYFHNKINILLCLSWYFFHFYKLFSVKQRKGI